MNLQRLEKSDITFFYDTILSCWILKFPANYVRRFVKIMALYFLSFPFPYFLILSQILIRYLPQFYFEKDSKEKPAVVVFLQTQEDSFLTKHYYIIDQYFYKYLRRKATKWPFTQGDHYGSLLL